MPQILFVLAAALAAALPAAAPIAQIPPGDAIVVAPFGNFTPARALTRGPDASSEAFDSHAETAREAVERALVKAKLPVVDRSRLEAALIEETFATSGLVDGRSATKVGAKLGARWLVTGTVGSLRELNSRRSEPIRKTFQLVPVRETNVVVTVKVIELATLNVHFVGRYPGTSREERVKGRVDPTLAIADALKLMAKDAELIAAARGTPRAASSVRAVVMPFANSTPGQTTARVRLLGRRAYVDRFSETARDAVEGVLVRRGVAVVDRLRVQDALAEFDLVDAGVVDASRSAEVGRFLSARYVITGSIHSFLQRHAERGTGREGVKLADLSVKVLIKVLDIETSRIVYSEEFEGTQHWEGITSPHMVEAVLERALEQVAADELASAVRGDG